MQTKHKYIKGTDNINRGKLVIAWLRFFLFFCVTGVIAVSLILRGV